MTDDAKIAKLEADLAKLKEQIAPTQFDERAVAAQRDANHQAAERRASRAVPPEVTREWAVVPDDICRGLARDARAPTGPSYAGVIPTSQVVSNVRTSGGAGPPGGGSGWQREVPFGPSPHQRYVDQQIDAADAKDRAELIERDARLKAMEKLAEPKP